MKAVGKSHGQILAARSTVTEKLEIGVERRKC